MSPYAAYFFESLLLLIGVCLLAVVLLVLGRKFGFGKPHGPLALRGHLPLDARRAVYLVQVGEQVLVVGASEGGLTKLGEVAARDIPLQTNAKPRSFIDVLRKNDAEKEQA